MSSSFSTSERQNEKNSVNEHEDIGPAKSMNKDTETGRLNLGENVNAKLANPLHGLTHDQLTQEAKVFAETHGMEDLVLDFQKGALVAQDPTAFESLSILTEEDKELLRRETTHKWSHPRTLYYLVVVCSMAAAVQGMDEAVINGANLFFASQFGIDPDTPDVALQSRNQWLYGLVNSAPYLCCAVLGCWLTDPLNRFLGRRGTIFVTAVFSFITCIWQGLTNSWWHLFISRFVLGIGIGPKSATVPVYAAECAPPAIRGALVMMWQMWTAFGIMLGTVVDLAFLDIPDRSGIEGLKWRLMLGSAGIPALFLAIQVFLCPESPRWYMLRNRHRDAFNSLMRLRHSNMQAARDLYYMHVLLEAEKQISQSHRNRFIELFTVPRNRRATQASLIVMFMQQFCGINVIAYYSTTIFVEANLSEKQAQLASWGYGMINWLFAIPAFYTIDTFGRRNLLLTSFPLMAIFLLLAGFGFWIPYNPDDPNPDPSRIAVVALGIYLFAMSYSPGEGPVPFTYSAEAFPLYVRDIGMSLATAVLWLFNFVLAFTWPRLLGAFRPQGAFGYYAAWNMIGFFAALLFVPETKGLSLEELDQVFSVSTRKHASYQLKALPHNIKKYIFRMKVEDLPPLYEHEGAVGTKTYAPGGAFA
ncbi:mfs sugar transporter [Moniliophthora roreri MCA 2997]|uniref:Mfs sugar transporter n=1 Tax=Moniliophthora roreri (strain MCA 2997) TaxID=1381753 RepID=V2WK00_MONRO|nr:mfs sugar transporter [Moniliophthora roreri MCA 2997]